MMQKVIFECYLPPLVAHYYYYLNGTEIGQKIDLSFPNTTNLYILSKIANNRAFLRYKNETPPSDPRLKVELQINRFLIPDLYIRNQLPQRSQSLIEQHLFQKMLETILEVAAFRKNESKDELIRAFVAQFKIDDNIKDIDNIRRAFDRYKEAKRKKIIIKQVKNGARYSTLFDNDYVTLSEESVAALTPAERFTYKRLFYKEIIEENNRKANQKGLFD